MTTTNKLMEPMTVKADVLRFTEANFWLRLNNHIVRVPSWTLDEIHRNISAEISASEYMDAPNKPGYYRANND